MEKISKNDVILWAKDFLSKAEHEITAEELKEQKKYALLIQNPNDKTLLSKMLDESSQIQNNKKLARRMKLLIERYGVPSFFSTTDTFLLKLFTVVGYWFDFISVPIFKMRLRSDTSKVIINEKARLLNEHLNVRNKQEIGQNVNLLGEVVLGNSEANHRYLHYLEALKDPRINYISIKISGIYAQINPLNYELNKLELCERLAKIYQQSIDYPFVNENGVKNSKFVNLDMEEYKDTELTLDVFMSVLSLNQFHNYSAGIVLQAYLPDAWNFQTELLNFAKKRYENGGAALKMRLVKGANLQMESIVSSLKGWENPILNTKIEVDANYLHILDRALEPENAVAMHIGVASHNFFSIGYAYLLSVKNKVDGFVAFEMLEGMANHLPRVMRNLEKQIILYTPVVKNEHFLNAISYLVRRLDENTGKDNFLSYSFGLKYDSEQWNFLKNQFIEAYDLKDKLVPSAYRTQNRNENSTVLNINTDISMFKNEPDTNFDLKQNRIWAEKIKKDWKKLAKNIPYQIPIQIGSKELTSDLKYQYFDHNQEDKTCVCELNLSNFEQIKEIISISKADVSGWRQTSTKARNAILHQVAENLANKRGYLIGCMSAITGKTITEGDVEVSEAIDFCRYYPLTMLHFNEFKTVKITAKGIILVIPPWNFPLAIPVGGVAAALAAGNSVILKPAKVAMPVAWEFAKCFWDAGVAKDALQVVCTDGSESLNHLTSHPAISHIILTGGTDTAFRLLQNNPTCSLSAETGGKNAIILTASGDRNHAIQNIVTSAFSNSGQKCSACSLLLLEKEVYNDPEFKLKLIDAVTSLKTGSVWDGGTIVGPMITNTNEKLLHSIENLEDGEWWLVKPEFVDKNKYILKPTVKWGVKPRSYTFKNELFAPLLGVVCIDNLQHGIELVNSSDYGLTSGLQSLDESEQLIWKSTIEAGNLYINRGITGAIVNRQPFGGMKLSAFGAGLKAGGRNYVSNLFNFSEIKSEQSNLIEIDKLIKFNQQLEYAEKMRLFIAYLSYTENMKNEFSNEIDIHQVLGEQNTFRYLAIKNIVFRILPEDSLIDCFLIILAANTANSKLTISIEQSDIKLVAIKKVMDSDSKILIQGDIDFLKEIPKHNRIRVCSKNIPVSYFTEAAKTGKYIATEKPITEGRLELLHYLKEQSIAFEYHRYGSINI